MGCILCTYSNRCNNFSNHFKLRNMTPLKIMLIGFSGFIFFKLLNFRISGRKSKYSPKSFNFKYWIADRGNWNDILLGFLTFGVIARYKESLFFAFPENTFVKFLLPFKDEEFFYFVIGFLITFIMMGFRMLLYKIKAITKIKEESIKE